MVIDIDSIILEMERLINAMLAIQLEIVDTMLFLRQSTFAAIPFLLPRRSDGSFNH